MASIRRMANVGRLLRMFQVKGGTSLELPPVKALSFVRIIAYKATLTDMRDVPIMTLKSWCITNHPVEKGRIHLCCPSERSQPPGSKRMEKLSQLALTIPDATHSACLASLSAACTWRCTRRREDRFSDLVGRVNRGVRRVHLHLTWCTWLEGFSGKRAL